MCERKDIHLNLTKSLCKRAREREREVEIERGKAEKVGKHREMVGKQGTRQTDRQ